MLTTERFSEILKHSDIATNEERMLFVIERVNEQHGIHAQIIKEIRELWKYNLIEAREIWHFVRTYVEKGVGQRLCSSITVDNIEWIK